MGLGVRPVGAYYYVHNWWYRYHPNYQNLTYLGGDCTNFASQAWHEGGRIPFDKSGTSKWYHYGAWWTDGYWWYW